MKKKTVYEYMFNCMNREITYTLSISYKLSFFRLRENRPIRHMSILSVDGNPSVEYNRLMNDVVT